MESAVAVGFTKFIVIGLIMLLLASVDTFIVIFYTYGIYFCLKRPIRVMRYIITKERSNRRIGKVLRKCFELKYLLCAISLFFMIPQYIFVLFMWILFI